MRNPPIIISAFADGRVWLRGRWVRCALGRAGVIAAPLKREGDGATPAGLWTMREVLWRSDRRQRPETRLPVRALSRDDGWCDAPGDAHYNRAVRLPHSASAEHLFREDDIYDVIVVLGYNDRPVTDGAGSAIFLHMARADYGATQGCVGLSAPDLLEALTFAAPGAQLLVSADPSGA